MKSIVGAHVPDSAVIDCLKGAGWSSDQAMDKWYSNGWDSKYPAPVAKALFPSCTGNISDKNVETFFYQYSTPKDGTGVIADEALEKFITDMQVALDDPVTLALAFAGSCAGQQYTFPEFKKLCNELKVDSMT